ncbi:putative disease resistance RPP13-like protein 1 [Solanum verrucosum]|uniref:putative disease resistance RPP13-like protein 1 n=1 Tax=Solanum verrucosum TaxID=315347 RepID=UPI0020D085BB|nr:putative disease resistance RPP13-like protein 1 [Solanum verrucosum]
MEIGIAVGGAFLSSALNVLFDRLAPNGDLLNMFKMDKRDVRLLKKLRMTLLGLQAVLSDAENKQASNQYVSQWLNELKDAVDGAENLIEEVNYEVLRLKVEGQHQYLGVTSNRQVNDCNLCFSDDFFLNIKEKLEDTIETLEELEKQIGRLDLTKYLDSGKQEKRESSTSLVDESDILGRQNEIEELIDRLLSENGNGKNLTVVPIVGMGGVGKTTLAKAVYNDESVKKHFDLKAWICVSEPYDILRITKELLQEIGLTVDNNLNQLQVKLKESLKGKKFLIVLDDVWNDDYKEWDDLRNIFVQGDVGSKIIVTTRKESVALMMGSGAINVGTLSSEVSWALFKQHSLENRDPEEHPELEEVGKQISHKCKGLPLALKALAGILRSKFEVNEWTDILRSEIWELPHHPNGILPALMLSYNDLPPHLKRCFAFCAIYPKDYLFCKEQVIHLWIANGLVQQLHSANQYFLELRSRSLFERVRKSSEWTSREFLMHDLVNDLAQIASSNQCIRLEDIEASHMLERTRHLSYSMDNGDFGKLKILNKLEQLRTLLPINIQRRPCHLSNRVLHDILPRLTSLRALSLSHYTIKELPNDLFIKLKHLRFLDLSWTNIKKLPDSICVLYNLETLLLSHCSSLKELPLHMEKLINLRHLDISEAHLRTPLHLSKLKNLHALVGAKFLLSGHGGSRMEDLYGSLSILELQNVVDRRESLKANMREKKHVERLSLEWSGSNADNSQTEREILDELQPNTNIKEVRITCYRGTKFPNWLADHSFHKLIEVSLIYCKNCDSLPALGQLPCLKFLTIRGMHQITEVSEEFYGSLSCTKPFNSLEKLEFIEMPEWKQWHVLGKGEFPVLEELWINGCPKLIGKLPENLSSLTRLRISECPELSLETPYHLSGLKNLLIKECPELFQLFDHAELFASQLQGMMQLESLIIESCRSLTSLPNSSLSKTLKKIEIHDCEKLKLEPSASEMFLERLVLTECNSINDISPELVPRAHYLSVNSCHSLTRLLISTGTEDLDISGCENLEILLVASRTPTLLRTMKIHSCKKLKSLPEHMQELLPSLNHLLLYYCPEIKSFPEGGLPFSLEVLEIWYCKKLENDRKEWHLQRLPCLRELKIFHGSTDEEIHWELPCSIQRLEVYNMKTLSSQLLKSLTSLQSLSTLRLPQIQSMIKEGLPSSLSSLTLSDHRELHSLSTEGLRGLTSLRHLQISSCSQLQSLPESALPSSLSWLTIHSCPKLQHLPVKGMPSALSKLSISHCPLLNPRLEFMKGEYWPNIAHISTIQINGEYL